MPITASIIGLMLVLLACGLPVGFALGVSGSIGLYFLGSEQLLFGILVGTPLSAVSTFELVTVPMFILMAQFMTVSGITDDMFDTAAKWVGRMPGGLAIATTLTGAAFGAVSGSSTASAATLSGAAIPAMIRQGYDRRLATGVVGISGTLAMLIPPSIAIILYGVLSEQSIAKLLIAGVVPGLLVAAAIIATTLVQIWRNPSLASPGKRYSFGEKIRSLRVTGPFITLFTAVTGIIYLGVATPTEASGLGAFGALTLAILRGRMNGRIFIEALFSTGRTTAMIMMIVLGAHVFGYFLTMTQTTQNLVRFVMALDLPSWAILVAVLCLYVVLGCILDQIAIIILTVPLLLPPMVALGYDPIWFGIIIVVLAEIGLVTPPVGMNIFVVARYTDVPLEEIFIGVAPYVVALLAVIALLAVFPQIVLWLPATMGQ